MKVIFIHGIKNEENTKESIERDWVEAIKQGLNKIGKNLPESFTFEAAYYGKILADEAENWTLNQRADVQVMGASNAITHTQNSSQTNASLYREFERHYNLNREQITEALEGDTSDADVDAMARGIHKKWLKAIARALEKVVPTRGKYIARFFLRQASAYLSKAGLKQTIDDTVFDQVFKDVNRDTDLCVVSHSLGTIVAYTLLRQSTDSIQAKALFTLGSPLGIEFVKQGLGIPKICLPNVEDWINIADKEDFVALKPELNGDTFWCDHIENHSFIDNGYEDAHSVEMYLSQEIFAKRFSALLGF